MLADAGPDERHRAGQRHALAGLQHEQPPERDALDELTAWVRARFAGRLQRLELFGSRARGEGDEDSDLDVLVVVDELTAAEGKEVAHHCGDLLTRHDVIVSAFTVATAQLEHLRARERRIVREIERDGIPL